MATLALPLLALAGLAAAGVPRQISIVNQCSMDVDILQTGGSTTSSGNCSTGTTCPDGSSCYPTSGLCYWNQPTPSSGSDTVTAGSTVTITYPAVDGNVSWSGNIGFCPDGTGCMTVSNPTASGSAPAGPFNLAEITILYNTVDTYDISNIYGVNVPMSFGPDNGATDNTSIYDCGTPGAPSPTNGAAASSWTFTPPSFEYQFPYATTGACTADSDCASGQVCGTVYANGSLTTQCGTLGGYWSENKICSWGIDSADGYFKCTETITNGPYTPTLSQLLGCDGTSGSCYTDGADANCCGCPDWSAILGVNVPTPTPCENNNTVWDQNILPALDWLKAGSPTSYTYSFDDKSSTFTCSDMQDGVNVQNYSVTLCPASGEFLDSTAASAASRVARAAWPERVWGSRRL